MNRLLSRLDLDGPLDPVCGVLIVLALTGLLAIAGHAAFAAMGNL